MNKIMTYSELSDICDQKRILLKNVAENSGLTYDGLRNGMIKQSLGMTKVLKICECVGITPNQFFGVEDKQTINATQYGLSNSQNIGITGIDILQQQLTVKDEQIKHLLNLLNKLNK
jgi:hypothetical protein